MNYLFFRIHLFAISKWVKNISFWKRQNLKETFKRRLFNMYQINLLSCAFQLFPYLHQTSNWILMPLSVFFWFEVIIFLSIDWSDNQFNFGNILELFSFNRIIRIKVQSKIFCQVFFSQNSCSSKQSTV